MPQCVPWLTLNWEKLPENLFLTKVHEIFKGQSWDQEQYKPYWAEKKQADKKQVRRKKAGKKASYTDADNADGDDEGDEKASGNMRILQRGLYW